MVSVVIPLYNKEKEIAKAIKSVLSQTYGLFELIVVNDGSTDKGPLIVQSFKDRRIRLINKTNGGVSSARNFGIQESEFELIAFLDGDDWWAHDCLETLVNLSLKYPDAGFWGGQYVQVNKKNELVRLDRFPPISEDYFEFNEYLYAVCSSSIMVKKKVFSVSGYFDEELTHGEDTDMWVRIGMKFKACYSNKIISYYNIAGNPLTKSTGRIPAFKNHFLSKIDNYIGIGGQEWDNTLTKRKAHYLRSYIIQCPFNKSAKKMIQSLPLDELRKKENDIFKKPMWIIWFRHILMILSQRILRIKNWLTLKFSINSL
jgi:glycosyltransferase involved in cell wall biosynthesis